MASKSPPKHNNQNPAPVKKRLARGEREKLIVAEAKHFFAENGFRASTRDLARRMGVTQALLYRYFPSKNALIDRIFEEQMGRWDPSITADLLDSPEGLEARLIQFYQRFAGGSDSEGLRLFLRAELDEQKYADRYTPPLNDRILRPVVLALRRDNRLPTFEVRPMLRGERELAMSLHGAIVHLRFRKHLYGSPLPDDLGPHITFYVQNFLAGVPTALKRIHAGDTDALMQVELGINRDGPQE